MGSLSLMDFLKSDTRSRIKKLEDQLEQMRLFERRLAAITKESQLRFRVSIGSNWDGEKCVSVTTRGSLKKAMENAIAEFKKVNERSDVQAMYHVVAILPGKDEEVIVIPDLYWRSLMDPLRR